MTSRVARLEMENEEIQQENVEYKQKLADAQMELARLKVCF